MPNDLVKASPVSVPAIVTPLSLPELVERPGGAARFAWDEFFYAQHHNPPKGVSVSGVAVPGLVQRGGGRADRNCAGHGRAIHRRPGRVSIKA